MAETGDELLSSLRKFILSAHGSPPDDDRAPPRGRSLAGLVILAITLALGSMLLEDSYSPFWTALGKIAPFLFGASLLTLLEEARVSFARKCGRPVVFTVILVCFLLVGWLWWIAYGETRIPVLVTPSTVVVRGGKDTIPLLNQRSEMVLRGLRKEVLTFSRTVTSVSGGSTDEMTLTDTTEVGKWIRIRSSGLLKFAFGKHRLDLSGTQQIDLDPPFDSTWRARIEGWFPAWYRARERDGYAVTRLKTRHAEGIRQDSLAVIRSFRGRETSVRLPKGDYAITAADPDCRQGRITRTFSVRSISFTIPLDSIPCRGGK